MNSIIFVDGLGQISIVTSRRQPITPDFGPWHSPRRSSWTSRAGTSFRRNSTLATLDPVQYKASASVFTLAKCLTSHIYFSHLFTYKQGRKVRNLSMDQNIRQPTSKGRRRLWSSHAPLHCPQKTTASTLNGCVES